MKKRRKKKRTTRARDLSAPAASPKRRRSWLPVVGCIGLVSALIAAITIRSISAKRCDAPAFVPRPQGIVTFTRDIAPIVFEHCAPCHRPGQAGPFDLLTYADLKKRAKLIAEVTERRYMPPWLPESGYGDFADERRLSANEIGLIKQWVTEGSVEGRAADMPALPKWPDGWELGPPDLITTLPSAYSLASDGKDVYRNFVVPIATAARRFVRAVELHPGNHKVVHHAFIEVDPTGQAGHLVDRASPPGFDGMQLPDSVQMPGGQMLGWQPGKPPFIAPDGLAWVLEPGSDLVLQMHLHPSGKPESVLPEMGFYFTDKPPTNTPFRINLMRYLIDIPPGARDYAIENRYVLPVDVSLLRINPHTHYLGKELQGYALLPDGTKKWLLLIKNWDFNWQGDYRYREPVFLPRGTTLVMHYTYDNSSENIHNPSQPPKRVKFGLQTTDEMGELWFQVLPRDAAEREKLANDFFAKFTQDAVEENEVLVRANPGDAEAQLRLGSAFFALGRVPEAIEHLRATAQIRPDNDVAHFQLGSIYLRQNRLDAAKLEFENVLRLKPDDFQASGSLGYIFLQQGNLDQAEIYLENTLRMNSADPIARSNLERVRQARAAARPRP